LIIWTVSDSASRFFPELIGGVPSIEIASASSHPFPLPPIRLHANPRPGRDRAVRPHAENVVPVCSYVFTLRRSLAGSV
jgi:hypothetical protein